MTLSVEEWSIAPDTGGAGRWRGGCAAKRVYRVLFEEATCTVIGERGRVAPDGVFGGLPGALFEGRIERAGGGVETMPSKGDQMVLSKGDRVTVRPAGSGGYGDPHERPPELVLADVLDGYISADAARALYGVAVAGEQVDGAATHRLRAGRRGNG